MSFDEKTDRLDLIHRWVGVVVSTALVVQVVLMILGRFNSILFALTAEAFVLWGLEVLVYRLVRWTLPAEQRQESSVSASG